MLKTIRTRLVLGFIALSLAAVTLTGALSLALVGRLVQRQQDGYLLSNAEVLAGQAQALMRPFARPDRLQQFAHTAAFMSDIRVQVYDRNKRLLADSGSDVRLGYVWLPSNSVELGGDQPRALVLPIPPGREPLAELRRRVEGLRGDLTVLRREGGLLGSWIAFETLEEAEEEQAAPSEADRTTLLYPIGSPSAPDGYVQLSRGKEVQQEALTGVRNAFLLAAVIAAGLTALVGLVMGRRMTSPIERLTVAAQQMGEGDLSVRAPELGGEELRGLAVQFNRMASRLHDSFEELKRERDVLKRFIADASHELRTPLTALKTFNELMQREPDDHQMRTDFLHESQQQIQRMEWITHNLLSLSRLEAGLEQFDRRPLQISDLVEAALTPLRSRAEDKGVTLRVALSQDFEMEGDPGALEIALGNVLQNAIAWTPAGKAVEIGVTRQDGRVQIWVQDEGPGIQEEDLPHIFERFYRSRGSSPGGSGLGLAIAKATVQAHSGTVIVANTLGLGARFTIDLPAGGPSAA